MNCGLLARQAVDYKNYNCEDIATRGLNLNGMLIKCERADVFNSVVVYVKAPYEMSDNVVLTHASSYTRLKPLDHRACPMTIGRLESYVAAGLRDI